ncbi:hypothetical protein CK203_101860 [Vitis vinifera]|uniref:Uncharacterized protein n=1 Tax=Vitis vinifera TaxID=29760 RepID=A0A438CGK6_VITVI|nr:hypothetical protein CK203_101860 [Vitis vinifera]
MRGLNMIQNDPELSRLRLIQAPLVDVEIRGVPALKFMGDMVGDEASISGDSIIRSVVASFV